MPSQRTETSRTFELSNGARETRLYQTPVNYQDAKGEWQPIGQGFQQSGGAITNGSNSFQVTLPAELGASPLRFSVGGQWVSEQPVGIATRPATLGATSATYRAAAAGPSLHFVGLPDGVKEDIELPGPSAPSTDRFELDMSKGLTPSLTESGSVGFATPAGREVAEIPAPVMLDSSPTPQVSAAVHYELEKNPAGAWTLTVVADSRWLAQPGLSWPVTIDPTIVVPKDEADCAISSGALSEISVCGTTGFPFVGVKAHYKTSGADEYSRTLLRFDLHSLPAGASVYGATLGLLATSGASNTEGVRGWAVSKPWTTAVNWHRYASTPTSPLDWEHEGGDVTAPTFQTTTEAVGTGRAWWTFSEQAVATTVEDWLDGKLPNDGFLLSLMDEQKHECSPTCTERLIQWASSAVAEAERPYLAVDYYVPAPADSHLTAPAEGTVSAKRFKLAAAWTHPGVTGILFQHQSSTGAWEAVPAKDVTTRNGQPVEWPVPIKSGARESPPLYWNAAPEPILSPGPVPIKGRVRAVLVGTEGGEGYTEANEFTIDQEVGGPKDPTAEVGPGTVDLSTGNLNVSETDVQIPGFGSTLEFTRSFNSRKPGVEEKGVLGPGWVPGISIEEEGGSAWKNLKEETFTEEWEEEVCARYCTEAEFEALEREFEEEELEEWPEVEPIYETVHRSQEYHYALLTTVNGGQLSFEKEGTLYKAPPEMTGWSLVLQGTRLILSEPGGDQTFFENPGGGNEYVPGEFSQPGGVGNKAVLVWVPKEGKKRLTKVIAPTAAGISCPAASAEELVGCHVLSFTYQTAAELGLEAGAGERLTGITYWAASSAKTMGHWEVAHYHYNAAGRLIEEWDPRLTTPLRATYAYETGGDLQTVKPAGLDPWTLVYGTVKGEPLVYGRLVAVKRASLLASPTVAQTTIAYQVPVSGAGAPYEMGPSNVKQWGQVDAAMEATAIFPPDQVPASPPTSYSHATVYYTDVEGHLVDTATPSGAGTSSPSITTTETDEFGNVVRELTPQNRLRVLAKAEAERPKLAEELETRSIYSPDGTELLEETGPAHTVQLESGTMVKARLYRVVEYDQGMTPGLTPVPHLPTTETTGALVGGTVSDQHVTKTGYDWTLREPDETIIDPGKTPEHLNIVSKVVYDDTSGLPIERRQPSNPEGGKAGTTKTIYYSATGSGECVSVIWANLPCQTSPAAQPVSGGLPNLLVTKYLSYDALGEPTEIVESPAGEAGNARRTVTEYDVIGRPVTQKIEGGGAAIPKVEDVYQSTTGLPTVQHFVCGEKECTGFDTQATTTTYDALGRPEKYEDADGGKAEMKYDIDGRLSMISDGKGAQTLHYDEASGLLTKLEDSGAGTFTAAYDADGSLVERGLPDGLTAKTTYNEVDEPTKLAYTKTSSCGESCTWFEENLERSINGQILSDSGTLVSNRYSYDKAGRLTEARETPHDGTCTTRAYTYDSDSNRLTRTVREPGVGGACATTGSPTQKYSYDAADRLLGTGISYDPWGRIKNLPAEFAGGKALETTYYPTNMVATQSQGGVTNSYELDASLRQRQRIQAGGVAGTEVFHYDGPSDSPAWTSLGSTWSRNITGIGGELAAVQESTGTTTFKLTDLHGDVVASASSSPTATKLLATYRSDEFGEPVGSSSAGRFGWLGGKERRTELSSGVIQMGARSYIPQLGRFLTPDPIPGGSANAYDYANQDPVNLFDLTGEYACPGNRKKKNCLGPPTPAAVKKANRTRTISTHFTNRAAARRFIHILQANPGWTEHFARRAGEWKAREIQEVQAKAQRANELTHIFGPPPAATSSSGSDCVSAGIGAGGALVVVGAGVATGGAADVIGVIGWGVSVATGIAC